MSKRIILFTTLGLATACGGGLANRDADAYRNDSRQLLMSRNGVVKSCYDQALQQDPQTAGTVVVQFKVEPESGTISSPQLDGAKSTAPATLGQCVVRAIDGQKLEPPDRNEGIATFQWDFKPGA